MTVYVDNSRLAWRGKRWCHLVADSISELHAFADQLGLKREWFQDKTMYPHYDVTVSIRQRALSLGAMAGDKREIITCAKRLRIELTGQRRLERENEYATEELFAQVGAAGCSRLAQQSLFAG